MLHPIKRFFIIIFKTIISIVWDVIVFVKRKFDSVVWRLENKNNLTRFGSIPGFALRKNLIKVNSMTYGQINTIVSGIDSNLSIGRFCSIASDVIFILQSNHRLDCVSTYPFKVKYENEPYEAITKGHIIIDDDVWIGFGATILSGVHIGQGAVVAAGAVVTKDIPPYAIVGGIPAKIIKYRFSPDIIEKLLKIDYSKLDDEFIKTNIDNFYQPITTTKQLDWILKSCSKV